MSVLFGLVAGTATYVGLGAVIRWWQRGREGPIATELLGRATAVGLHDPSTSPSDAVGSSLAAERMGR